MISPIAGRRPDQLVAVGDRGARTVSDLLADSAAIAAALRVRGPGDVLLIFEDRYHFAAALLGAWRAGRAVLLPPNGQPGTIHALAHGAHVAAFLHDRAGAAEGTEIGALLGADVEGGELEDLPDDFRVATLATSGSVGDHALCPKTAAQLLGEAARLVDHFRIRERARILATVPSHHIYGLLFGVLAPLRAGAAFVREIPLHAEAVAAAQDRHAATHLVSVPAHLRALEALAPGPRRLERVFSSGAPLLAATARAVARVLGLPVTEIYGSSETGGIAWREAPDEPWRPFPGVVADATPEGRLLLRSPLLAQGSETPLPCADRIALHADGRFTLLGRLDDVVKVAGKRVALTEVETRALAITGVRDAAAVAEPVAGSRGTEIWLAVAAEGLSEADVRTALERWLDPSTLPRRIRMVQALPREENGKLRRDRLRALWASAAGGRVLDIEPDESSTAADAAGRETRSFEATVPPELEYFRGHFPDRPILAGIVQLHTLVLRQVTRSWPDLAAPRKLLRLKFKRVIGPGARVRMRLVRAGAEPRVAFEIESGGAACASGVLLFGAEAP